MRVSRRADGDEPRRESERFDRRLGQILEHAADVFYEKGYEGASMRDLSRASGMSLAGLYYYFESKERLLYLIQKHTFETVLEQLKQRLEGVTDPVERLRIFVRNHLEYFLKNRKAMTVLSHEDETLKNSMGAEIRDLKRDYYKLCLQLLENLKDDKGGVLASKMSGRIAVLSLFGMMNWIYTWYNPRVDVDAEELAREMSDIFLHGVLSRGGNAQVGKAAGKRTKS